MGKVKAKGNIHTFGKSPVGVQVKVKINIQPGADHIIIRIVFQHRRVQNRKIGQPIDRYLTGIFPCAKWEGRYSQTIPKVYLQWYLTSWGRDLPCKSLHHIADNCVPVAILAGQYFEFRYGPQLPGNHRQVILQYIWKCWDENPNAV